MLPVSFPHESPPLRSHLRALRRAALVALLATACLAPPPPIVVDTPFGAVRAESAEKAEEVADLLEELAPRVRAVLPGSQKRAIDVWVQNELRVYRSQRRPETVRGFTLLADEFDARRIHLQEDGQSAWYLSHELVHALIGESWRPLPGILEEGLGDVIAEALNPDFESHIRAHRLLNAASVVGGFDVTIAFVEPQEDVHPLDWPRREQTVRVRSLGEESPSDLRALLSTSRPDLHRKWPEIPEALYGFAWLVTSRIVERHGLEGLHELCLRATREGYELVPIDWLADAAGIDFDRLDPTFLGTCFGRREMVSAAYLQTEIFIEIALGLFRPLQPVYRRGTLTRMRPTFVLADGSELPFRAVRPLQYGIYAAWRMPERDERASAVLAGARTGR